MTSEKIASEKANIDEIISNAKTVNGLLSIAETKSDLSRNHALKVSFYSILQFAIVPIDDTIEIFQIVSILAEWSTINKAKLSEFENDTRFVKLCKVLGRSIRNNQNAKASAPATSTTKLGGFRTEDLNVILGVTGDDEAAKMVARLSLQQMVKVLKNLALKKRRSIPLLRSLTFNMSSKEEHLDIKQCGDVLYSLATLNYPDPLSIKKICVDIQEAIKAPMRKSSAIGSVLTSLALLKYRDTLVLDVLTEWIIKNQETCRTQDLSATVMSLAILNYTPEDLRETLKSKLSSSLEDMDFKNSFEFLNYCWSLMSLGFYHEKYFNIVLSADFVQKIKSECFEKELTPGIKMKLLNINGGVKLFLPNYSGSMLDREKSREIYDVPLIHNKEKQMIVSGMNDSLKSLIPHNCLKLCQNTNMGFLIGKSFVQRILALQFTILIDFILFKNIKMLSFLLIIMEGHAKTRNQMEKSEFG